MNSQKIWAILLWAIIAFVSFWFYQKENKSSIIQYNSTEDFDNYLDKKLAWIINSQSNKEGHCEPIMSLNDNSGQTRTEIWLTEGELDTEQINPISTWRNLLKGSNAIIVNSPDEKYTCHSTTTGTLVSNICKGCNLTELDSIIKMPGDVIIVPCNGSYKNNGLFSYVANAIVVNQKELDSTFKKVNIKYENGVDAIWKNNSHRAIRTIFEKYQAVFSPSNSMGPKPEILVFTGIGTNHGRVPVEFLYRNFFHLLDSNYNANKPLPPKIFINLHRKQILAESSSIYYSLKKGFTLLYNNTNKFEVKRYEIEWMEMMGLSIGLLLLILSIEFFVKRAFLRYSSGQLSKNLLLITVGHFLTGYGFLKIIEKVPQIDSLLHKQDLTWTYFILGTVAIPLSFVVPVLQNMVKPKQG
jgi:hypothetical protein